MSGWATGRLMHCSPAPLASSLCSHLPSSQKMRRIASNLQPSLLRSEDPRSPRSGLYQGWFSSPLKVGRHAAATEWTTHRSWDTELSHCQLGQLPAHSQSQVSMLSAPATHGTPHGMPQTEYTFRNMDRSRIDARAKPQCDAVTADTISSHYFVSSQPNSTTQLCCVPTLQARFQSPVSNVATRPIPPCATQGVQEVCSSQSSIS